MKPINKEVLHLKSGTVYTELYRAIDCTNCMPTEMEFVVYTNGFKVFIREAQEFDIKFKPL